MFVPGKFLQASLMFASKAGSLPLVWDNKRCYTPVSSGLTRKHQTKTLAYSLLAPMSKIKKIFVTLSISVIHAKEVS